MDIALARARLDRAMIVQLLIWAAVFTTAILITAQFLGGRLLLVVVGLIAVFWLINATAYVWTWTRMRGIASPLSLRGEGVIARSPLGQLSAPWTAMDGVAIESSLTGKRLRFRLVPAGDARRAGVQAQLPASVVRRVDRRGFRYSLRVLDISEAELRQAVLVQSGGRFTL